MVGNRNDNFPLLKMAGHLNMNMREKQSQHYCKAYRVSGTCLEATSQFDKAVTHLQGRSKMAGLD